MITDARQRRPALDVSVVFDPDRGRRPKLRHLLREAGSLLSYPPDTPSVSELPDGQGRAVLVIPPLFRDDSYSRPMRRFLGQCGFQPFGWELGINWGPTARVLRGLEQRVRCLSRDFGPIAVVGVSLGGLLARNVAHDCPDAICHVVTVASPVHLPTASQLEPLIRVLARHYSPTVDPARLGRPLAMPSTMIWTADDGVVAPSSCWTPESNSVIIELDGPHVSLGRNPEALRAIVRRLAGTTSAGPR